MKPHPRIRKTVKWGGAGVAVLLVVVWAISCWWGIAYWTTGGALGGIQTGCLWFQRLPPSIRRPPGLNMEAVANSPGCLWWFSHISNAWASSLGIPIWAITLPVGTITVAAWRLDTLARRRARLNLCPKCHYDRAGLAPGAVCPECGSEQP